MSRAQTVLVKTHKIDVYGRYVGHIFNSMAIEKIQNIFTEGRYLNQELIARELAQKY